LLSSFNRGRLARLTEDKQMQSSGCQIISLELFWFLVFYLAFIIRLCLLRNGAVRTSVYLSGCLSCSDLVSPEQNVVKKLQICVEILLPSL